MENREDRHDSINDDDEVEDEFFTLTLSDPKSCELELVHHDHHYCR